MAGDYFLKIDGIEGESQDPQHKGEIELESFSWSEAQPERPTGAAGGAGKVSMSDFQFTMLFNKASLPLLLAVASGQHIKSAVLSATGLVGKSNQTYLTYKFTDLLISSYRTDSPVDQGPPVDQVSFNFGQIQVEYSPQLPTGALGSPVQVGWDVRAARSV
jgi:type VI secretion system secreted protein Hcp